MRYIMPHEKVPYGILFSEGICGVKTFMEERIKRMKVLKKQYKGINYLMRKIRKPFVILLAVAFVLSMGMSAYANSTTDQLTKSNGYVYVPGDGVNEGYTLPTQEQIERSAAKLAEAKKYVMQKREDTRGYGTVRVNWVYGDKQEFSYSCGAAAARNAINDMNDAPIVIGMLTFITVEITLNLLGNSEISSMSGSLLSNFLLYSIKTGTHKPRPIVIPISAPADTISGP